MQKCTLASDCGSSPPSTAITAGCAAGECSVTAGYWIGSRPLTVDGTKWTVTGDAAEEYAYTCNGTDTPTTITLELEVTSGKVVSGLWVADRLDGSVSTVTPPGRCTTAREVWSAAASRM